MDGLTLYLAVNGIVGQVQVVRKKSRGFVALILGQIIWLVWESLHFSLTWPLMFGTTGYLVIFSWGWIRWRRDSSRSSAGS